MSESARAVSVLAAGAPVVAAQQATALQPGQDAPKGEGPLYIPDDHPAFDGHFPGHPLLPGVVLLAHVLEAVSAQVHAHHGNEALTGIDIALTGIDIGAVKFLAPVLPGATLDVRLMPGDGGKVRFEVWRSAAADAATTLAASGQLTVLTAPMTERP